MAWILGVDEERWEDREGELLDGDNGDVTLASLRPRCVDPVSKRVDNILAVHALDPGSLLAHLTIYEQAMRPTSSLLKQDREMIALIVSQENGCHY